MSLPSDMAVAATTSTTTVVVETDSLSSSTTAFRNHPSSLSPSSSVTGTCGTIAATVAAASDITSAVPIIDLQHLDANELRHACCTTGFFYLAGHGIHSSDLDRVLHQTQALFHLSTESKLRIQDRIMTRGYTAMGEERLDPVKQTTDVGDTKEGFYIAREVLTTDPDYDPAKFAGPNQWPTPETTPEWTIEQCLEFRETMEWYFRTISTVALRVVRCLALALRLPSAHYFDPYFVYRPPMGFLRLLHYAATESDPDRGIFACGAHSDYGMITVLLTDDQPGLQILQQPATTGAETGTPPPPQQQQQDEQGSEVWIDVPPKPGHFIVNLGDMLERWSNGLFRSTVHRVITKPRPERGHHVVPDRYSLPFFYEPNYDTIVKCLDVCCSPLNPPKYPPTTSGQHLKDKYLQTHADYRAAVTSTSATAVSSQPSIGRP